MNIVSVSDTRNIHMHSRINITLASIIYGRYHSVRQDLQQGLYVDINTPGIERLHIKAHGI